MRSGFGGHMGWYVEIEIYSDVVCAGCYLGGMRLEEALVCFDGEAILRWRAFQVSPEGPDTFDAHRLLWFADQPKAVFCGANADTQPQLAALLHRAYLDDGLDVASHDVLVALAVEVGLDRERVSRLLASTEGTADVRAQIARAHDMGITSVPTFVFNGRYAVTGEPQVATFRAILDEISRSPDLGTRIPAQRAMPACDDDSRVG